LLHSRGRLRHTSMVLTKAQ